MIVKINYVKEDLNENHINQMMNFINIQLKIKEDKRFLRIDKSEFINKLIEMRVQSNEKVFKELIEMYLKGIKLKKENNQENMNKIREIISLSLKRD